MIYEHKISNTETVVEMYENGNGKFMHQTWTKLIGVQVKGRNVLKTFTHRDDGPAVVFADGYKAWYIQGKLHRIGGPAVIDPRNGYEAWWENGKRIKFWRIEWA